MTENEIAAIVVDAAYCLHKHFGPGLSETVYEVCLVHELRKRGLRGTAAGDFRYLRFHHIR